MLDLTVAYDSVPRRFQRERMRRVLPKSLGEIVEAFLVPSWICTIGYLERKWFVIDRGVPQVSLTSPSLYNLFMDKFAERLSEVPRDVADIPVVLLAYDVLLTADSTKGLQKLLEIATNWGEDRQMKWNVNPGKNEVVESEDT